MKFRITYLYIVLNLFYCSSIFTQRPLKENELLFDGSIGGGISSISLEGDNTSSDLGFGAWGTASLNYYFHKNYGIGLGAGYSSYSTLANLENYEAEIPLTDYEQFPYLFRITTNGIQKEAINYATIDIPVYFIYRKKVGANVILRTKAGAKIGVPISSRTTLDKSNFNTRIYYPDLNAEIYDIPSHGLYENRTDWKPNGELETLLNSSLVAEFGFLFPIHKNLRIGTSIYGSYGLSNVSSPSNYWFDEQYNYNGISSVSDKTNTWQVGLNVSINFGFVGKVKTSNSTNKTNKQKPVKVKKTKEVEENTLPEKEEIKEVKENTLPEKEETKEVEENTLPEKEEIKEVEETILPEKEEIKEVKENTLPEKIETKEVEENTLPEKEETKEVKETTLPEKPVVVNKTINNEVVPLNLFGFNETTLDQKDKQELNVYLDQLIKNPGLRIRITGHSCDKGSEAIKKAFAGKRANNVKTYFKENGISPDRIIVENKSDKSPLVPNNSEENRQKNRRIELQVID